MAISKHLHSMQKRRGKNNNVEVTYELEDSALINFCPAFFARKAQQDLEQQAADGVKHQPGSIPSICNLNELNTQGLSNRQ